MGIIQLVLADWPVSIIETASVLVKRKLYTCTYSYVISIFVFLVARVNTMINSLKWYLCLHDLSYCRIHVPINHQPDGTKISLIHHMGGWNGTVKMSMIWIKDIGSVQMYRKWFVFLQQSKISHFSFCNPTTSEKSITCDQEAWLGRRYNGIFSRSEWCWYIINLTVNKVWLAPSSGSFWVIPTWK